MTKNVRDMSRNKIIEDFQMRDNLIATLKNRFTTYGYKQVRTSTFEHYDMYADIPGTVNKDDMIKIIDTSGKILVLRPDVTIPITRLTAANQVANPIHQRLFYVLDVFRRSGVADNQKESTQAGIECFGENTPAIDSEVIMLAIHTLKDLGFSNFKIEIGHAGFYKELIQHAGLSEQELELLQEFIQSKNITEIESFLNERAIDTDLKEAIQSIPILYGEPEQVIQQANEIIRNKNMQNVLQNLIDVYDVLKDYGAEKHVVLNLGLINNMNYYTGIIFQGFVDMIGQPVLMGGRYDHLGSRFNNDIPAIGFAFEVDSLLQAVQQKNLETSGSEVADIVIYYSKEKQKDALTMAYEMRSKDYQVLAFPGGASCITSLPAKQIIVYEKENNLLFNADSKQTFLDKDELFTLIKNQKGDL